MTTGRPRHAPYAEGTWRLAMGLQPLAPADWIEIDEDYPSHIAEKERLIATRREAVFGALAMSEPAQEEVLAALLHHLPERFPDRFRKAEGGLRDLPGDRLVDRAGAPALLTAARLVQEDLCLLQASPEGFVLTSAALCFPAFWRLHDKLGRALPAIHAPVPGYDAVLAGPFDRVMARLPVGRPVWRVNWSMPTTAALFTPGEHPLPAPPISAGDAGARIFLRIERQTLTRLPDSGAILFTIRTHLDPLEILADRPDLAQGLAGAVAALTPAMAAYKGIAAFRPALLAYLDRLAASGRPQPEAVS